ncbi:hypothetical protein ACN47E_003539 [Coniothyrium glycines]
MLLQEPDQEAFKRWVLPKLETISDVDAEVLADYVIALVTSNDSEADIRRNSIEQLAEFLGDKTESIVNEVLITLKEKSYHVNKKSTLKANVPSFRPASATGQPAPIPSIVGTSNHEYEPDRSRPTRTPPFGAPRGPAATRNSHAAYRLPDQPTSVQGIRQDTINTSRKRKLFERERSHSTDGHDSHFDRNGASNRPAKQSARKNSRNARAGVSNRNGFAESLNMPKLANLPPPPPGPLPFDPTNPMAFLAMAAAFGVSLPGMPPMSSGTLPENDLNSQGRKARCEDYHTKGFCALGNFCSFEHGDAIAIPADKIPGYDPDQPLLPLDIQDRHRRGVVRSRNHGNKGGRRHTEYSQPGPSYDQYNTTLVVEQIPDSRFSEDEVRAYFSEFGQILEVQMHTYRRLALVKFKDYQAANRAYMSPKAVFENRFVKVYWQKRDLVLEANSDEMEMLDLAPEETPFDMEEFTKRQAEAQKAFEERRKKDEEAAANAEEIERKLEAVNEEIRQVKQQLAVLAGDKEGEEEFSQSLANLQAEAEDLFAQHEPEALHNPAAFRGRGRGSFRGGYRGRGYSTFTPLGRGSTTFRGSYRGRGHYATAFTNTHSAVKRLDNRPRRLAIAHIEVDSAKDEALRQHLLNVPDCTSIERHPEQTNTLIITFKERYQAEMFIDSSLHIPDIGKLELSWVPNDAFGGIKPSSKPDNGASDDESSATMGEQDIKLENEQTIKVEFDQHANSNDADMDVADDVDEWL